MYIGDKYYDNVVHHVWYVPIPGQYGGTQQCTIVGLKHVFDVM